MTPFATTMVTTADNIHVKASLAKTNTKYMLKWYTPTMTCYKQNPNFKILAEPEIRSMWNQIL